MLRRRLVAVFGTLAVAAWLGGLISLGALVAPVVFSQVPTPWSADAMTVVFRRFDLLAMGCAAILLACEAVRAVGRAPFARAHLARAIASVLAAAAAVYQGTSVSPGIAELHAAGAVRGVGAAGAELSRLHDLAEALGKAQVVLLVMVIVLEAVTWRADPPRLARTSARSDLVPGQDSPGLG
jgi:hypothetical protein